MRMQRKLRDRTDDAIREAVRGPSKKDKSLEQNNTFKLKMRRCCQAVKDTFIEKELKIP